LSFALAVAGLERTWRQDTTISVAPPIPSLRARGRLARAGVCAARLACSGEDRGEPPPPLNLVSLTILYVEDNRLVSEAVRDLLTGEGWSVEVCADGNAAMNKLAGGFGYDLLLLDNELPGASGIDLTRYARSLSSYRHTPIIMVSATDCRADARNAGVDLFLRKPDEVEGLVDAVRRLVEVRG
jgi:two-component system, chemotaxis family, chemotaxis protein CheY